MAGPGGGPSRRSHTKSRKGCKTCKRRHIRCDETFPQCKNCTKHQVRCDYMDNVSTEEGQSGAQADLLWTPEIESTVEHWRSTGEFPFPELHVFPQPQWQTFSKTDLRLIHHLLSISNEMYLSGSSKLTVWTENMPKFLSNAATHPFVMHAILAFSASHLAWISQSSETRDLAYHHHGIAVKGLHEAIATFCKANADAILSASLLLTWQATDWRGWASLMMGTRTIIQLMQPWRHESKFADYLTEHKSHIPDNLLHPAGLAVTQEMRLRHLTLLQRLYTQIQALQPFLANYEQENRWIEQLKGYIQRLRATNPAQSAEEQFSHLYALRKWLFWVPISLLQSRREYCVLLVLGYFYATALSLEQMFPDVGTPFCANMALGPLEEILRIFNSTPGSQAVAGMIEFPREAAVNYRARQDWFQQQIDESGLTHSPYGLDRVNLDFEHLADFSYTGSPAFAPSPAFTPSPSFISPTSAPSTMVSGQKSPFLEVPSTTVDSYFTAVSSGYTSPLLGSPAYAKLEHGIKVEGEEGNYYNYVPPFGYSSSGFVATTPTTLWA